MDVPQTLNQKTHRVPLNVKLKLDSFLRECCFCVFCMREHGCVCACACMCILSRHSFCFCWHSAGCWQSCKGCLMLFPVSWDKDGVLRVCACVSERKKTGWGSYSQPRFLIRKQDFEGWPLILFSNKLLSHTREGNGGLLAKPELLKTHTQRFWRPFIWRRSSRNSSNVIGHSYTILKHARERWSRIHRKRCLLNVEGKLATD